MIRNLILPLACSISLAALPVAMAEPEPHPSANPQEAPNATQDPEPSATPQDGESGDDQGGDDGNGVGEQGELSLHGFYEGTTASGALVVFYVESNTHLQINVLDVAGQQIGFAEGDLTNGDFSLTLTNSEAISGAATEDVIEGTLAGQAFSAEHVSTFGEDSSIGGRYVGAARPATAPLCSSSMPMTTS